MATLKIDETQPDPFARGRRIIDAAHAADPTRHADGRPAELAYADAMEAWLLRLRPDAPPLLRLAARCQHLERWLTPRTTFPEGKAGYLRWRQSLYKTQAERAFALLVEAGLPAADAEAVRTWVSKTGLRTNPHTQALEDAAVLVFLDGELAAFAHQHADYPREKFITILAKTWRKLSPSAQAIARDVALSSGLAPLWREAIALASAPGSGGHHSAK